MVSKNYISLSQNIERPLTGIHRTQTDNIKTVLALEITKTQWRVGTGNSHYYTLGSLNFFYMSTVHSSVNTLKSGRQPDIPYFTNSFSRFALSDYHKTPRSRCNMIIFLLNFSTTDCENKWYVLQLPTTNHGVNWNRFQSHFFLYSIVLSLSS